MTLTEGAAFVAAGTAIFGVLLHMAVYAYREGRKEERLIAVEKRVEGLPAIEVMLAKFTAEMSGVQGQLTRLQADLKADIAEINHTIRNHLFTRGDK